MVISSDEAEKKEQQEGSKEDGEGQDEEWDESFQKETKTLPTIPQSTPSSVGPFDAKSLAGLDRIHLKITKAVMHELHVVLDLIPSENEKEKDKEADKASNRLRLPLNQLTWMEIIRMRVLCLLYSEMGRSKEDIQHAIRGSKSSSFKSAKNVIRNIRYRLAIRTCGNTERSLITYDCNSTDIVKKSPFERIVERSQQPDDLLARMQCIIVSKIPSENELDQFLKLQQQLICNSELDDVQTWTPNPSLNKFMSEQEITAALSAAALNSDDYSEEYRRACRVLLKILGLNQAKNFIWEVNSVTDPDYYRTVRSPIFFVHIASKLVDRLYSDQGESVSVQFYEDMRKVPINCICFFSEYYPLVAQAQKLVAAIYRHSERWLLQPLRERGDWVEGRAYPTVEQCDEKFCLLSFNPMEKGTPLKCGKCFGLYSCEAVYKLSVLTTSATGPVGKETPPSIYPAIEILEQSSEEWLCPLCLREDSTALVPALVGSIPLPSGGGRSNSAALPFYYDEWGPSAVIPWTFNLTYTRGLPLLEAINPDLSSLVEMVRVLTDPSCSSIPRQNLGGTASASSKLTKLAARLKIPRLSALGLRNWTISERLCVLSGLCTLLRSDGDIAAVIEHLYSECERLIKISSKPNFREADFISLVREICGEEGVSICRGLLDGISVDAQGQLESALYLQNMITEGRCVICNGSTFEEESDEAGDQILLCDGCNAEAHLKCLNLSAV